jgi:putative FmdB family regulatory protein
MPAYHFVCLGCGHAKTKLLSIAKSKDIQTCEKCSAVMQRHANPPTSQTKERLDNGFMNRAIERLYKERAAKDPLKDD